MEKNSDKSHGSTGIFPHRFGRFLPLVTNLPSENSIFSNFSSPRGVAILGCESHSQAGSASCRRSYLGQYEKGRTCLGWRSLEPGEATQVDSRNTQSPLRPFLNMEFTNINRFHYMEKGIREDQILTIDLSIWFRLERVNSNFSLKRKMKSIFQSVRFKECTVLRRAVQCWATTGWEPFYGIDKKKLLMSRIFL